MTANNAINNTLTTPIINQPNIVGVTDASDAAAGSIGQLISSVVASGAPVSLTNNTVTNITSISLTAGDWDVWGNIGVNYTGSTIGGTFIWSSQTSATLPDASLFNAMTIGVGEAGLKGASIPSARYPLSGTTTVYLSVKPFFADGTAGGYGGIYARRRR